MGKGFCFISNQYRLEVDGDEFFIDLLFFNHHLRCLIAFELKKGKFKPADAGHLNFYQNVLDEKVKLQHENSSIGIVDSNYFQNMMMINCKILQNMLTELLTELFLKRFTKINDIKSLIIFSLFEIMFPHNHSPFFFKTI